uniref:SJCHGC05196 protein n=1 Tax=Schistosoma japonicum TaxID=6182 RepID=Q5DDU6_SCHJA|nr:SJCHGC05196 protein [Schistosoma japonicum]
MCVCVLLLLLLLLLFPFTFNLCPFFFLSLSVLLYLVVHSPAQQLFNNWFEHIYSQLLSCYYYYYYYDWSMYLTVCLYLSNLIYFILMRVISGFYRMCVCVCV